MLLREFGLRLSDSVVLVRVTIVFFLGWTQSASAAFRTNGIAEAGAQMMVVAGPGSTQEM